MGTVRFVANTEADMRALGARVMGALFPEAFVALHGGLGAGKTAFVRGAADALGLSSLLSPTFTIVREYDTDPPLIHFDAYRLADSDALYGVGYADYFGRGGVLMMEWADLVPDALPKERLDITITGSGTEAREVLLQPHGAAYESVVEKL